MVSRLAGLTWFVGASAVHGRHFRSHRAQVRGKLPAMMNAVVAGKIDERDRGLLLGLEAVERFLGDEDLDDVAIRQDAHRVFNVRVRDQMIFQRVAVKSNEFRSAEPDTKSLFHSEASHKIPCFSSNLYFRFGHEFEILPLPYLVHFSNHFCRKSLPGVGHIYNFCQLCNPASSQ